MTTIPELQEKLAYSILSNKCAELEAKIKIVAIAVYWLRHEQKIEKADRLQDKAVEILGNECLELISSIHRRLADSLEKPFSGKKRETILLGKR